MLANETFQEWGERTGVPYMVQLATPLFYTYGYSEVGPLPAGGWVGGWVPSNLCLAWVGAWVGRWVGVRHDAPDLGLAPSKRPQRLAGWLRRPHMHAGAASRPPGAPAHCRRCRCPLTLR